MMDDFLQFLREPIAQRSLLACVMIGFANGFVSGLVILKKSALQSARSPVPCCRALRWRCSSSALPAGVC